MTVAVQTPISSYTGNGVTTAFSFGYYVAAAGDLVVMVDGVVKALTTDYTLTGIGSGSGGTCTFVTAPASGADVVLYRDTDLLRETDYQDNGDLLAAILNGDFDRIWLALQEVVNGAKSSARNVRAPVGETINELPDATTRAGKVLSFNASTGQPEAVAPTSGTATDLAIQLASTASGEGAALIGYMRATTASARTANDKLAEVVTAKDFGIVGDGSTDDSTAFAAALAALGPGVTLRLSGLTIKINQQNIISAKVGFTIDGEGATIIAAAGMPVTSGKELLTFRSCTDFSIKNLTVDGNRANRTPIETPAHNIEVRSCQRFIFERVRSINAVVDGFILNTSTPTDAATFVRYGVFVDCTADNCYRQGMSIINAYNIVVSGGAYNNTNGVSPQSGIDVESNSGAATPGNAYILIQGVGFSGNTGPGVITSAVSSAADVRIVGCSFTANTECAVLAAANNTVIDNCSIRGHTSGTQGLVRFPSSSPIVGAGVVQNCTFSGNTAAVPCIYVHSSCFNVSVLNNKIIDHANAGGISMFGTNTIVRGNYVSSAGGVGITAIATDPNISGNVVSGCAGRGIYTVGSVRPYISENIVRDITSVSGGYIQSDDADAVIERNHCISSTAATTTIAVYIGNNSAAQSVSDNVFVNLHSTNPITVVGSGSIKKRANNLGGTDNPGSVGWSAVVRTNSYTVATLPTGSGAYTGARALVTDANATTFASIVAGGGANVVPVYHNGTNWIIG